MNLDLDLPYGPWKKIAAADWMGFPTSIYQNSEWLMLFLIFEKHEEKVAGVVVELKKAFLTDLDFSKAAQAQRREITVVEKVSPSGQSRFAIVGATPAYAPFSGEGLIGALGRQHDELKAVTKMVGELSASYRIPVRELSQLPEGQVQALLGDPIALFAAFSNRPVLTTDISRHREIELGMASLGEEPMKIGLGSFQSAVILGGSRAQRLGLMQVACEGALLAGIPCLVIDSSDSLEGLGRPSARVSQFPKFRMTPMPLGFPIKKLEPGEDIGIDISQISPEDFCNAFGLAQTDVEKRIAKAWEASKSLPDVREAVGKDGKSSFSSLRAMRILRVIERRNPGVFSKKGSKAIEGLSSEHIGKAYYLGLSKCSREAGLLLIGIAMKSLKPSQRGIRALVAIEPDLAGAPASVAQTINSMQGGGIAFVTQAEHELDLNLLNPPTLKLEIIGDEAVATAEGEKPVRFRPRPAYTETKS